MLNIAIQLAQDPNTSLASLRISEHIDKRLIDRYGEKLLRLAQANNPDFTEIDRSLLSTPLTPQLRKKLKACQLLVSAKAAELAIAPEMLARKKQLQELIRDFENSGEPNWTGELAGWRRQVLEVDIRQILMSGN